LQVSNALNVLENLERRLLILTSNIASKKPRSFQTSKKRYSLLSRIRKKELTPKRQD
jgi:hypothetical protein